MPALAPRPPRNTGPMEVRDFGPNGRRLGTFDDCQSGSRWELHRGELVEQPRNQVPHGIAIANAAALFLRHARPDHTVMADVYCDLTDPLGPSLRAPDVALVHGLRPQNDYFRGTPVAAVEVRVTQSVRHLEEKVALYLEHDWPLVWIVHVERGEVEVCRPGEKSRRFAPEAMLPLPPALQARGLTELPAEALCDHSVALPYLADWAHEEGHRAGLRTGLRAAVTDLAELLELPLDPRRRAELELLDVDGLERLRTQLKTRRRW